MLPLRTSETVTSRWLLRMLPWVQVNGGTYQLSVAKTVLQVHTRVGDPFDDPMSQIEQQLRLTVEALRERQEGIRGKAGVSRPGD